MKCTSMKNPKTQVFKAMCQLKCLKFGLSGTPYQNKPEELHTIFDLLNTNCLGSRSLQIILRGADEQSAKRIGECIRNWSWKTACEAVARVNEHIYA